jgi:hypothetical protein
MANFLQVSEPEAAALDAQSYTQANNARLKNEASNALVAQYGPEAADPELMQQTIQANTMQQTQPDVIAQEHQKTQSGQLSLDDAHLQLRQRAALAAAQALKQATDSGIEVGTAYDTIVKPNAAVLGMTPDEVALYRQHFVDQPGAIDSLIAGLQGPAKLEGGPQYYKLPNGDMGEGVLDATGKLHVVQLPEGAQPLGPTGFAGAPQVVQNPDGSWSLAGMTKAGTIVSSKLDGTPVRGITALTGQTNAKTAIYRAGTTAQNSQYGAAPGTSLPNVGTARGAGVFTAPMQTLTSSIAQMFPGTRVTDGPRTEAQNAAVGGAANSAHLFGNAADFHIPKGLTGPQFAAQIKARFPGASVLYEGPGADHSTAPHVHVELGGWQPPAGQQQAQAAAGQGGAISFASLPPKGRQQALDSARGIVNGNQQLQSIDDQITNISKMVGPLSIGLGDLTRGIPGSPANNLQAALSTLRAQGLTAWLGSLKNAAGSTGIGRVLQSEATAAQNSFGALEQSQSEGQFRYHLGIFQQRIHQLQTNAEQAFKQQYGIDPYAAMGMPGGGATAGNNSHLSDGDLLAKYGVH